MKHYNYFGFITIFFTIIFAFFYWKIEYSKKMKIVDKKHLLVILYTLLCFIVYITSRNIPKIFDIKSLSPLFSTSYQSSLVLVSINLVLQLFISLKTKTLFYRMLLPSAINMVFSTFSLYFVGWGIINIVWFLIYSGALGGFIFVVSVFDSFRILIDSVNNLNDKKERKDILEIIREESNKYLKMGLQTFLALAASLGVSMSILFKNGKIAWDNTDYLTSATLIIMNFGFISIGFLFWIIKPYIDTYSKIRYFYKDRINKNHILLK